MSNELAIAAVTKTLRYVLLKGIGVVDDAHMTTLTPDKIDDTIVGDGLVNLFLYHVTYDAALANMAMSGNQLRPFETGHPPVPLVLHYLVTAYSKPSDAQFTNHRLLGAAMSTLHDHPLLGADEIEGALAGSELHQQIERVRITRELLSVDDMSKLWTTFQTNYRISAAYQVSAVLIESKRMPNAPLPVLSRGPEDSGVQSQADLIPPYPTLNGVTGIKLPENMVPTARLGEQIIFNGYHLDGSTVTAIFEHPRLDAPIKRVAVPGDVSAEQVKLTIPNVPDKWPPGIYSISLLIESADPNEQDRTTNEVALALAPVVCAPGLPAKPPVTPIDVTRDAQKRATIILRSIPQVLPEQRAFILLSDPEARQVKAEPRANKADPLVFKIENAPLSGNHGFFIRLRIDGVDSLLVADYTAKSLAFDPNQKVIIHD